MTELIQARIVAEARKIVENHFRPGNNVRRVLLLDSQGLRLGKAVPAEDDVPGFDRSTMDGFAVKAKDTFGASESLPAYLDITGEIFMGKDARGELGTGQARKIPTGGMLPPGADAVVMIEHTESLDEDTIGVTRPVGPGENVVLRGEDVLHGNTVLQAGHIIRPQDLGMLAAVGVSKVDVLNSVRVGIISTGDEVVPVEVKPGPGQVRDINSYALYGQVMACGGEPVLYGVVRDDFEELRDTLAGAVSECDLVILSGGSSVGTRDVASKVIESLGRPGILFHGISIKPGKPTVGAVVENKPVFGLPGHPVSAMLVFELLVAPLVRYGEYRKNPLEFAVRARLTRNMRSAAGREDYIRVKLVEGERGELSAEPILGKSGLIATMVKAHGLAMIPADKEGVEAGEYVAVKIF